MLTVRRGRILTGLGASFEAFTASLPHYWVGMLLLVAFAVQIPIFPVIGGDGVAGTVLPVLTLAIPLAGFLGQVPRDEFDKVLDQPFVTTARTRGMGDTAYGCGTRCATRCCRRSRCRAGRSVPCSRGR